MKTIFTLNGYFNYGNRLQLFAMVNVLKRFGEEVRVYWPKSWKTKVKEFLMYNTPLKLKYKKQVKMRKFTRKYMPVISNCTGVTASIIGSDQVWNPEYFKDSPYLLDGNKNSINVSYAASMGIESLTAKQEEMFRMVLGNYKAISVREESARRLLQPLTDKKIEVVLDPTLLLDRLEYEKIEKRPKNIKIGEKYILCYILGNRDNQLAIEKFANENNCRVICFSDKEGSSYGVEEFLYLIHHAEIICTDSFHACVFSFIYERPFVIFKRSGKANRMYSRLQNLTKTFGLEEHEYNGSGITKENLRCDYKEGKMVLKKEQEKSLRFLANALEGKG